MLQHQRPDDFLKVSLEIISTEAMGRSYKSDYFLPRLALEMIAQIVHV